MRAVLACLVALSALSACGAETREPREPGEPGDPAAAGEWAQQRIKDAPGADSPVGLGTDGDDILVTVLGEDATLTSHLSVGGGDFEAGEPIEIEGGGYPGFAPPVRLDGTWWLAGTGGMVGAGNDERMEFSPRVLRSEDGLTWEPVPVTGIPSPVDLNAVVAVDGALVVVGDKRNGVDTGGASFEAAAWRSQDGVAWTEVALPDVVAQPGYRDESVAAHVVASAGRLLAGGGLGQRAALWSSDDAGSSWARVDVPEVDDLYQVNGLVADGSTVLVSGSVKSDEESAGGRLLRSDDGGLTFRAAEDQPFSDTEGGYARLWAGGGRFFTFTEPSSELYSDPGVCYADLTRCGGADASGLGLVHASDDGDSWSTVDTGDLGLGDEFVGAVGASDGRASFAHVVRGGLAITSWPGGTPLPVGRPPDEPDRVDLVQVADGADPEPGVRYHAPLFVHCGMDWLYLGDTPWQRTDGGPDVETGAGDASPQGWPLVGQTIYGYATLTEAGVVEYSIGGDDDEVIATYEKTGAQAPGCD